MTPKPDFQQMSRKELRAYVLNHRQDDEALQIYMERLRTEPGVIRQTGGLSSEDFQQLEQLLKQQLGDIETPSLDNQHQTPEINNSTTKIKVASTNQTLTDKEIERLEKWQQLTPEDQQKALELIELLKSDFVPKTPLAKKLREIRQRAIASGLPLLNEDQIERELAARRGGIHES